MATEEVVGLIPIRSTKHLQINDLREQILDRCRLRVHPALNSGNIFPKAGLSLPPQDLKVCCFSEHFALFLKGDFLRFST